MPRKHWLKKILRLREKERRKLLVKMKKMKNQDQRM